MCVCACSGDEVPAFEYNSGCEQQFTEEDHMISPSELIGEGYDPAEGKNTVPVAILMETRDGECGRQGP